MTALKFCPYCGGPMEDLGYGAVHIRAVACPLNAPDPAAITADEFDKRSRGYMPAKGAAE